MKWLGKLWRRLWGFRHEPQQVNNGHAAAAARAEEERKLAEARRQAAARQPDVRRAAANFTAAVDEAFGWRHR